MEKQILPIEIPKDPYNPVSDMDILKSLREPKKRVRAKKALKQGGYKLSLRAKFALIFIFTVAGIEASVLIGAKTMLTVNDHFNKYEYVRTPIVDFEKIASAFSVGFERKEREPFVAYVKVADDKAVSSKALTHDEKIAFVKSSNYSKIISGIWMLESNRGKNGTADAHHNDCSRVGMTNEFGYRALDNYCFNSFEESVKTVDKWIDEQLKTKTVSSLLCYYATGKATDTCSYAQNFQKLDNSGSLALK